MYSNQWPDLDTLKRLQDVASDLCGMAESHARAFEQHTAVLPGGHMQQGPSGPDKPKRVPRPG